MCEPGSDIELSTDSDGGYEDYYNYPEDGEMDQQDQRKLDPEYFEFECLTIEDVERFLNESVEMICASLSVSLETFSGIYVVAVSSERPCYWCSLEEQVDASFVS